MMFSDDKFFFLICWMQFLRKMAQPYDKTGGGTGRKTLLSQEDLEKMVEGSMVDMLF